VWNPANIWQQTLIKVDTSPVSCSHFTLEYPKKSFQAILQIHTYDYLRYIQNITNCSRDCELSHHIWKMLPHYPVKCRTYLLNGVIISYFWGAVRYNAASVGVIAFCVCLIRLVFCWVGGLWNVVDKDIAGPIVPGILACAVLMATIIALAVVWRRKRYVYTQHHSCIRLYWITDRVSWGPVGLVRIILMDPLLKWLTDRQCVGLTQFRGND